MIRAIAVKLTFSFEVGRVGSVRIILLGARQEVGFNRTARLSDFHLARSSITIAVVLSNLSIEMTHDERQSQWAILRVAPPSKKMVSRSRFYSVAIVFRETKFHVERSDHGRLSLGPSCKIGSHGRHFMPVPWHQTLPRHVPSRRHLICIETCTHLSRYIDARHALTTQLGASIHLSRRLGGAI